MPLAPIADLSLVCLPDVEEYRCSGATPDVRWEIDAVFYVPEPSYPQTFAPVPSDPDTAFRCQSEFFGIDESDEEDVVAQWICALRHGGNTSAWRAAILRNWKQIGLGKFSREHWPLVQKLLRQAGMLR